MISNSILVSKLSKLAIGLAFISEDKVFLHFMPWILPMNRYD